MTLSDTPPLPSVTPDGEMSLETLLERLRGLELTSRTRLEKEREILTRLLYSGNLSPGTEYRLRQKLEKIVRQKTGKKKMHWNRARARQRARERSWWDRVGKHNRAEFRHTPRGTWMDKRREYQRRGRRVFRITYEEFLEHIWPKIEGIPNSWSLRDYSVKEIGLKDVVVRHLFTDEVLYP